MLQPGVLFLKLFILIRWFRGEAYECYGDGIVTSTASENELSKAFESTAVTQ